MSGSPFDVLGVPHDVDEKKLHEAFRILAKKYHPDLNNDPAANKKMSEINAAYAEALKLVRSGKKPNPRAATGSVNNNNKGQSGKSASQSAKAANKGNRTEYHTQKARSQQYHDTTGSAGGNSTGKKKPSDSSSYKDQTGNEWKKDHKTRPVNDCDDFVRNDPHNPSSYGGINREAHSKKYSEKRRRNERTEKKDSASVRVLKNLGSRLLVLILKVLRVLLLLFSVYMIFRFLLRNSDKLIEIGKGMEELSKEIDKIKEIIRP